MSGLNAQTGFQQTDFRYLFFVLESVYYERRKQRNSEAANDELSVKHIEREGSFR